MTRMTLVVCITATAGAGMPGLSADHATNLLVAGFEGGVESTLGGYFQCIGGAPTAVSDRIAAFGAPAVRSWRIDVQASAPSGGVGGVIPLFDNRPGVKPQPLDVSAVPHLLLRLLGEPGARQVRVEVVHGPFDGLERVGTEIGRLAGKDLSPTSWSTHAFALPADVLGPPGIGAIRVLLDGPGAGWVAIDHVAFCGSADAAAEPTRGATAVPRTLRKAMWVWETARILADPAQREALVFFCRRHGVTDLFCQVPYDYKDDTIVLHHVAEQRSFNAAARSASVTVHALDGAPDFIFARNHGRLLKLLDALDAFNREGGPDARYAAVHMDNEPYVLPEWKDPAARRDVLADFITLNRELRRRCDAAGMAYGVDIPFWWDSCDASGKPAFTVAGPEGDVPLLEALFPLIQNVGIMSYRERVTGVNGVVACCRTEFELGHRLGVPVFAAVELGTGPRVEKGITFGCYPRSYFAGQLETLEYVLARTAGCAGLAIHAYEFYRTMEENP
ncbi:MAG: hypothetical protein JXB13_12060 [Phycisphaerae bacterium]|nr:hypothetical protein [Phycisphaerae bacterium]